MTDPFFDGSRSPRRESGAGLLEGFPVVFAWGLRRGFGATRFRWTILVAAGFGALLGFLHSRTPDPVFGLWMGTDLGLLGIAVPLVALALVGAAFGEEVAEQTLVYHLVRPVSRATVFLARFSAGILPCVAAAVAVVLAGVLASGVSLPLATYGKIAVVSAVGAVSVGAVYYALGALFRWGLVAGLVYTFVAEGLFQFLPGTVQDLSLMHHVRGVLHGWVDADFAARSSRVARAVLESTDASKFLTEHRSVGAESALFRRAVEIWPAPSDALLVAGVVAVAALVLGVVAVKRRDFALKE